MIATYVIAEPCIGVKDKSCVDVCPVDCIQGDDDSEQLYINADECISCDLCARACPIEAIFEQSALPDKWKHFIEVNAAYFRK